MAQNNSDDTGSVNDDVGCAPANSTGLDINAIAAPQESDIEFDTPDDSENENEELDCSGNNYFLELIFKHLV